MMMEGAIHKWLFDPVMGKFIASLVGSILVARTAAEGLFKKRNFCLREQKELFSPLSRTGQ